MSARADAETLGKIPIFAQCDPVHLQLLAFSSERRQFEAGAHLMVEGQVGAAAYLILRGEADVLGGAGSTPSGKAGPGVFLGEVAMIADLPYSLTVIARGPLTAARIGRDLFMRVATEYPEFGAAVFRSLSQKLDGTVADLSGVQEAFNRARSFSGQ
ncbi:MAG: cyclic nucleotide-binding domain-containing protein [Rhizobiales bacterium]|nr:cyclic nucleotide-binding domain-containing protein [Hyphomicrobiales bacterium]